MTEVEVILAMNKAKDECPPAVNEALEKLYEERETLLLEVSKLRPVADAAWNLCARSEIDSVEVGKLREALAATDRRHHAPMCPANHYHAGAKPRGLCSCGA